MAKQNFKLYVPREAPKNVRAFIKKVRIRQKKGRNL